MLTPPKAPKSGSQGLPGFAPFGNIPYMLPPTQGIHINNGITSPHEAFYES